MKDVNNQAETSEPLPAVEMVQQERHASLSEPLPRVDVWAEPRIRWWWWGVNEKGPATQRVGARVKCVCGVTQERTPGVGSFLPPPSSPVSQNLSLLSSPTDGLQGFRFSAHCSCDSKDNVLNVEINGELTPRVHPARHLACSVCACVRVTSACPLLVCPSL